MSKKQQLKDEAILLNDELARLLRDFSKANKLVERHQVIESNIEKQMGGGSILYKTQHETTNTKTAEDSAAEIVKIINRKGFFPSAENLKSLVTTPELHRKVREALKINLKSMRLMMCHYFLWKRLIRMTKL